MRLMALQTEGSPFRLFDGISRSIDIRGTFRCLPTARRLSFTPGDERICCRLSGIDDSSTVTQSCWLDTKTFQRKGMYSMRR